jgi:hypothetical protein
LLSRVDAARPARSCASIRSLFGCVHWFFVVIGSLDVSCIDVILMPTRTDSFINAKIGRVNEPRQALVDQQGNRKEGNVFRRVRP